MKKLFMFIMLCLQLVPISVSANSIYDVDMKIDILKDGTANIKEVWKVDGTDGTEWYKQLYNLGNSELSNFVVYMDGVELKKKAWDVNDSLDEKAGYYGINYTDEGLELCFGKSDYDRHTFTLNYTLSNYIFNTSDSQVLYWTLLPDATIDNFSVEVTSYYPFPDDLDVWGYGYKGYAYVSDSKIMMSNEGKLDNEYVVLLVKFPTDTFDNDSSYEKFATFDDVLTTASEDSFDYYYGKDSNGANVPDVLILLCILIPFVIFIILIYIAISVEKKNRYGYADNKIINRRSVPMFRDIPCNKDIYYASSLIKLNSFGYRSSNILGAIILKWVKNKKIVFKHDKNIRMIDLTLNPTFDNKLEEKLFNMMKEASLDGYLKVNELKKWCRKNYNNFLELFNKIENNTIRELRNTGLINKRKNSKECKYYNVMSEQIYNDSIELYGLKKYLLEFSRMDTKEVMDVHLWDEYLMFAYLFGIADKVTEQLKNLYPDMPETEEEYGYIDYDTIELINYISRGSVSSATSAKSSAYAAASSYSAGGGGFSSGGGGGGSFGGGGSMGSR